MSNSKEGYKQTEIGLIPIDWEVMKLGLLFEFKNGLNKEKQFFGYGTPILNYMDVFNHSGILSKDIKGKVFLTNAEIKTYEVKKGDVFFTRTSETVEEIGITTVVIEDVVNTVFSGFVLRGRPKNSILDLNFKKYCFSSNLVRREIISTASYTTRALTNGRLLANVKIVIPTLTEQTAIATALSDADGLITGLEKLIAKKRLIKQGAMQQLLQPKEGWEVKKLGDFCDFYNGKGHEQSISENGNYIVVNSKFVSTQGEVYKCSTENLFPLEKNDVTIVMSDIPNGKALAKCFIIPENNKYTLNQRIGAIRTNVVDYKFLYFILNRNDYYLAFDSGTGQTNLKKNDVLDCPLMLPPTKEEQTRIATILSDMDAELSALEQKLEKYKKVKLGMMQELLTGKTRLV